MIEVKEGKLAGAVLAGGRSTRMGRDKAKLVFSGVVSQESRTFDLLSEFCQPVVVSCRADQQTPHARVNDAEFEGPAAGLVALSNASREAAWLVVACDFPFADRSAIETLVKARDPEMDATVFIHSGQIIEPLFAIWEPRALAKLKDECLKGNLSPRRVLESMKCVRVTPVAGSRALVNVNSPEDALKAGLKVGPA